MSATSNLDLSSRLDALLAEANERLAILTRQTEEGAQQQQQRFLLFNKLAVTFLREEITTRMRRLASYFPNASVEEIDVAGSHGSVCRFKHSVRFPATVELRFCCTHDEYVRQFICGYNVEILPVYMKFEKHDQISTTVEAFDPTPLRVWLDDKIVQFTKTYLTLEFADQYQRENQATDPVSHARINRAIAAATTTYKGQVFYFLSDENRKAFEASPESYTVH